MPDKFTAEYNQNPQRFQELDKALRNRRGYMTETDPGASTHSIMEMVTHGNYRKVYLFHNPGQTTKIEAECFAFPGVDGAYLYGIFDSARHSKRQVESYLRRRKLIK